jgi:chromate transport protein ChrA
MFSQSFAPFLPVFLFDFTQALTLIIIIIDYVVLYQIFEGFTSSKILGLVIATIITFLIVIPYNWVAWLVFLAGFAYSFFWGFQPWTWAGNEPKKPEDEAGP